MKTENQLTVNTPIVNFSDEQIKEAIKIIEGDAPLFYALGLLNVMGDYI